MVSHLDLEQVIRDHFARIHRAALVLTRNPWDADDLAQETFLVFADRLDQYQQRSSVYTWLYGILLNLERRERRRQGTHRRNLYAIASSAEAALQEQPSAESMLEWSELQCGLWSQVAQLPDGQRQALVLRFSEGLRYEEIATVLDCPLGTVKSRIYHGLMALRRACGDQEEPFHANPHSETAEPPESPIFQ